jgi:hypothetical protein
MNIDDLRKFNGWYRAGIAVSLSWIVVATIAYFTSLGSHYIVELPLDDLLPAIIMVWWKFSYSFGFGLFEITDSIPDFKFTTLNFDIIGFIAYVLIPIAALWCSGFLGAWAAAGFKKIN